MMPFEVNEFRISAFAYAKHAILRKSNGNPVLYLSVVFAPLIDMPIVLMPALICTKVFISVTRLVKGG